MFHLCIPFIFRIVYSQYLAVAAVFVCLVKHAEHLYETVVHMPVQIWNLYYYAVVDEALHEWVRHTLGYLNAIVVVGFVIDIKHRLLNIPHAVPKQIDRYHRNAISVWV